MGGRAGRTTLLNRQLISKRFQNGLLSVVAQRLESIDTPAFLLFRKAKALNKSTEATAQAVHFLSYDGFYLRHVTCEKA